MINDNARLGNIKRHSSQISAPESTNIPHFSTLTFSTYEQFLLEGRVKADELAPIYAGDILQIMEQFPQLWNAQEDDTVEEDFKKVGWRLARQNGAFFRPGTIKNVFLMAADEFHNLFYSINIRLKFSEEQIDDFLNNWNLYRSFSWYREIVEENLRVKISLAHKPEEKLVNEDSEAFNERLSRRKRPQKGSIHHADHRKIPSASDSNAIDDYPDEQLSGSSENGLPSTSSSTSETSFEQYEAISAAKKPENAERFAKEILQTIEKFERVWQSEVSRINKQDLKEVGWEIYKHRGRIFSARGIKSVFLTAVTAFRDHIYQSVVRFEHDEENTTEYLEAWKYFGCFKYYRVMMKKFEEKLRIDRIKKEKIDEGYGETDPRLRYKRASSDAEGAPSTSRQA